MTNNECNRLVGRIIIKDNLNYTVTSASTEDEIHVWVPHEEKLLIFDSVETFENWMHGTPVSTN